MCHELGDNLPKNVAYGEIDIIDHCSNPFLSTRTLYMNPFYFVHFLSGRNTT